MSNSLPVWTSISGIRSLCSSAQGRGYRGYTPHGILWFYLHDHGEDITKWDGKPTSNLEAGVHESQGKTMTNGGSSRKIAAPVSSGQFPRQSRKADLISDPVEGPCDTYKKWETRMGFEHTHVTRTHLLVTNTMTRIRGALPPAIWRKRTDRLLDCMDSMAWHIRSPGV